MIISITGHRPDKLWGYKLDRREYEVLMQMMCNYFIHNNVTEVIQGCALGVDTLSALTVIDMKKAGYNIKLTSAVPCKDFQSNWKNELDRTRFDHIIANSDRVHYVSEEEYDISCLQKRNEWMVNNAQGVLAVWDGTAGGTFNCIKYANMTQRHVDRIEPKVITDFVQKEIVALASSAGM